MRAEIGAAQAVIGDVVGATPGFFRAPAGLRNPFLDPVLAGLGLELASWTRRGFDTVVRHPARVLARLANGLDAGDILLLHDGHAARSETGSAVILEVLPPLLAAIRRLGLTPVTLGAARDTTPAPVSAAP
jgi:peptidoglycan/xylan/chitin deacetylase (PgdA/CDA1 family)